MAATTIRPPGTWAPTARHPTSQTSPSPGPRHTAASGPPPYPESKTEPNETTPSPTAAAETGYTPLDTNRNVTPPTAAPRPVHKCDPAPEHYRVRRRCGTLSAMQFGRTYEEFEVGAVYKHWPGKTVTEAEDHLFCLITMNHHPLHIDAHYATGSTPSSAATWSLATSSTRCFWACRLPDVSGKAIANLEIESLPYVAPTFRRHHLQRDDRSGQARVREPRRPRIVQVGDPGVQAGRHACLRSGAQSWCPSGAT